MINRARVVILLTVVTLTVSTLFAIMARQSAARAHANRLATVPAGTVPDGAVPAGTVPAGAVPAGAVPDGAVPAGTVPAGTVPAGTVPAGTAQVRAGAPKPGTPQTYAYNAGNGNRIYAYWNAWSPSRPLVPWIVGVHGGYWRSGTGNTAVMVTWAEYERANGLAAFSIDYRLAPKVAWPTPERDVETAVKWIRKHAAAFGLDPNRGFILGGSSGGVQATVAALRLGGFAGVVSLAGANDVWSAYSDPVQTNPKLKPAALTLMGGVKPWVNYPPWADARAKNHRLEKTRQPFLLVHSVGDRTVNIKMADDLNRALRADGYRVWFDRLPGNVHVLTRLTDYALVNRWISGILDGSLH